MKASAMFPTGMNEIKLLTATLITPVPKLACSLLRFLSGYSVAREIETYHATVPKRFFCSAFS